LEFVCDFVRDESELLWFLGVKGFKLKDTSSFPNLKPFIGDYEGFGHKIIHLQQQLTSNFKPRQTKIMNCQFCQIGYEIKKLPHKLTLQMIIHAQGLLKVC